MSERPERFQSLQKSLRTDQAILLSAPTDLAYFANFISLLPEEREGFLLITANDAFLIKAAFSPLPEKYSYQVFDQCRPPSLMHHLQNIFQTHQLSELSLDFSSLYVDEYQAIQKVAKSFDITLSGLDREQIWRLRMVKDAYEIEQLQAAGKLANNAVTQLIKDLQVGITEVEVSRQIEIALLTAGADTTAFPTIVAFGAATAAPHYQPGTIALTENTPILIDMGAMVNGYRSDLTRCFWFGAQPDPTFTKIETAVQDAYQQTIEFLETSLSADGASSINSSQKITAQDLDAVARGTIKKNGYDKYFIHTTGHGVGIDIHEPPSLNYNNPQEIRGGMVITIEPGIYLVNQFGYRYENTILIEPTTEGTAKKIEILTL